MRIAIDSRRIMDGMSGLGVYTRHLITSLVNIDSGHEFVFYLAPGAERFLRPCRGTETRVEVPWPVEAHVRGDLWKNTGLPMDLKQRQIDLFHDPAYQLPLVSVRCKKVVTILDLSPWRFPETNTMKYNLYWKFMTRASARRADLVVTHSRFVRREIIDLLGVAEDRIEVVPLAASPEFSPGEVPESLYRRFDLTKPYIITTAKFEPRKNLERFLRAYKLIAESLEGNLQFVVAGEMGWKCGNIQPFIEKSGLGSSVRFTGYPDTADLAGLIRGARLAVVPSLYEGFGLPVLEAMQCGTPVVCSKAASLPEVGGDSAIYFDPMDIDDMARKTLLAWTDEACRNRLRDSGLRWSSQFSWKKTAAGFLRIYESTKYER